MSPYEPDLRHLSRGRRSRPSRLEDTSDVGDVRSRCDQCGGCAVGPQNLFRRLIEKAMNEEDGAHTIFVHA